MRSKPAQIVLYSLCVLFCLRYAIAGVWELMHPQDAVTLIQTMGETAYYVVTIARVAVCFITGIMFGRIVYRIAREK